MLKIIFQTNYFLYFMFTLYAFASIQYKNIFIYFLKVNNNIGLTGPIDNGRFVNDDPIFKPGGDRFVHTQAFVSIRHMEIFGTFFPEHIKNWFCDDWITRVYYPDHFYTIDHYLKNIGGDPRYDVETNCPWEQLIVLAREHLKKFI